MYYHESMVDRGALSERSFSLRLGDLAVRAISPRGDRLEAAIAKQVGRIFPPELLQQIDQLKSGTGENIRAVLGDIVGDQPENKARMLLSGLVAGGMVAGVQNGEKFLQTLGLPPADATYITLASQAGLAILTNGLRWPASRTYHTVNTQLTSVVGGDLARIIESSGVSLAKGGIDVRELVKAIGDGYTGDETNERFKDYITGFAMGIFVGNCLMFKPLDGALGAGVMLGLNKLLDIAYPKMLGGKASQLGQAITEAREARDLIVTIAQASRGGLASANYQKFVARLDHTRRALADEKNYTHYLWVSMLPILATILTRLAAPDSLLSASMYTYSQIANAVFNRLESQGNQATQQAAGVSALRTLRGLVTEALEIQARYSGVRDQQVSKVTQYPKDLNGEKPTEIVYVLPQVLKVAQFTNKTTVDTESELTLDRPISFWSGEVTLLVGREQVGKSSLLGSIARIRELENSVVVVPNEARDYSLRRELARLVGGENYLGEESSNAYQTLVFGDDDVLEYNAIICEFVRFAHGMGVKECDYRWFTKDRKLSGQQQLMMNTLLAFLCRPPKAGERSIILFDDPMGVLTIEGKQRWVELVDKLMLWQRGRSADGQPSLMCAANDVEQSGDWTDNDIGPWLDLPGLTNIIDLSNRETIKVNGVKEARIRRFAEALAESQEFLNEFDGKIGMELLLEQVAKKLGEAPLGGVREIIDNKSLFAVPIGIGLDWLTGEMVRYCLWNDWFRPGVDGKHIGKSEYKEVFETQIKKYFALRLAMNELATNDGGEAIRQSRSTEPLNKLVSALTKGLLSEYKRFFNGIYQPSDYVESMEAYLGELGGQVYSEMYPNEL